MKTAKTEFKNYKEAIKFLDQFNDEKKAAFDKKIINSPNLKSHGIYTKQMSEIIKKYSLLNGPLDYSFELTSLILASNIEHAKDDKAVIKYLLEFIQHVDNWAHIDVINGYDKVKRIPYETLYPLIKKTRDSDLEFVARFYYVSFLNYKSRVELYDDFLASIKDSDKYYTMMGIAWVIAEMFPQADKKILKFLADSPLSKKTKLKAIQKIKESRKTTDAQKEKLEKLRAKIKASES